MAVSIEIPAELVDATGTQVEMSVPIPDAFLDRKYRLNKGLLASITGNGTPITSGPDMDPAIRETRSFYAALGIAPPDLASWKIAFGIPARLDGEDLQQYRDRAGIAVYYNKNELGLGRELGCGRFPDGTGPDGETLYGVGCFVTNYGTTFRDPRNALRAAIEGQTAKNTVCITYRPSMEETYRVQFYVYGADGQRQDWAQLDDYGPRPAPMICMNCHGGSYDRERHLARHAHFLPADPNLLVFSTEPGAPHGLTREGQEERIRGMNEMALSTPLAPQQIAAFGALYDGHPEQAGRPATIDPVPSGWRDSKASADLYIQVVKPHCATCHLAEERTFDGSETWSYGRFLTYEAFMATPMLSWVCGRFEMPNAQPTMNAFWRASPVVIDGRTFASPADAFLDAFGATREECHGYEIASDCRRGGDDLCGNSHSGAACDQATGRCVPDLTDVDPDDRSDPTGWCTMDASRTCPKNQECRPMTSAPSGFDGGCRTCGLEGYPACEMPSPSLPRGPLHR